MSTQLEITDRRSSAIEQAPQVSIDPLLAVMDKLANNPALDADKIERLMNVFIDGQRKMREMEDERAFAAAMADFKKNTPEIIKRKQAKIKGVAKGSGREYEMTYSYADLEEYVSAAEGPLAERGITWSFPFSESNSVVTVSCVLRYGLYKHTPTTLSSPADDSGSKNNIQAKGSAISYLERYTFCGATGLVAAMPDRDGRTTPEPQGEAMEAAAVADFISLIEGSGDHEELQRNYFSARDAAEKAKDKSALSEFAETKNKMYKMLLRRAK